MYVQIEDHNKGRVAHFAKSLIERNRKCNEYTQFLCFLKIYFYYINTHKYYQEKKENVEPKKKNEELNALAAKDPDGERKRVRKNKEEVDHTRSMFFFEYLSINNDITHIQVPKNQSSTNKRRKTEKK